MSKTSVAVAHNIINNLSISTAMWATEINGTRYPTYETFIWVWDAEKKERGKMVKQHYHKSRDSALSFHFRFCRLLAFRQLKKVLPNDNSFVDITDI